MTNFEKNFVKLTPVAKFTPQIYMANFEKKFVKLTPVRRKFHEFFENLKTGAF